MENSLKEKLLRLSDELIETLNDGLLTGDFILEDIKKTIKEIENEESQRKVQQKFNGVEKCIYEDKDYEKAIELIEFFKGSVEKNAYENIFDESNEFEENIPLDIPVIEETNEVEDLKERKITRIVLDIDPSREVNKEGIGIIVLYETKGGLKTSGELDSEEAKEANEIFRNSTNNLEHYPKIYYKNKDTKECKYANQIEGLKESNELLIMGSDIRELEDLHISFMEGVYNNNIYIPIYVKYHGEELLVNKIVDIMINGGYPHEEVKKQAEKDAKLIGDIFEKAMIELQGLETKQTLETIETTENVDPIENTASIDDLETIVALRTEMENILGKSLYAGIEYERMNDSKYDNLSDEEKETFNQLKSDLISYSTIEENKPAMEQIRFEMFLIVGRDNFDPYFKHKDKIDTLSPEDKARFDEIKEKHEKLVTELLEKNKKKDPVDNQELTEDNKKKKISKKEKIKAIKEKMAKLLYGEDYQDKDLKGIENIDVDNTPELDTEEKKAEFKALQEELNNLTKRKGKKVVSVKSAKNFYQKHKKIIHLALGIAILCVAMHALLPSIMYLNSVLWHQAILTGASAEAGLPLVLHNLNGIFGAKIGATYAAGTGMWTLANGAILNAGAAQAGILASLGKVALSVGGIGVGATVAVKNLCKLAKEKFEKIRNREKDQNKKRKFFNPQGIKDKVMQGINKGKDFYNEKVEKHVKKKLIEENGYTLSHNKKLIFNNLILNDAITEEEIEQINSLPTELADQMVVDILLRYKEEEKAKSGGTK